MTMKKKRKKGSTEFVPGDLVRSTSIRPYNLRHVDESHLHPYIRWTNVTQGMLGTVIAVDDENENCVVIFEGAQLGRANFNIIECV